MTNSQFNRIIRNSTFLFASRFIDMMAAVLMNVILARTLGAVSFGQYSFISAYIVSIAMISYFGLDNIATRDIARYPDRASQYLGTVIIARWIMSALAALLILAGLPFIELKRQYLPALSLLTASELTSGFVMIQLAVFRAKEQMQYEIYITTLWRLINLLFISLGAFLGFGITGLCAVIFLANVARGLFAAKITKTKFFKPDFSATTLLLKDIFRDAFKIGIAVLITNWIFRSAQLAIKFLLGPEPVAYFQVSHAVILQISTLAMSIAIALFPTIANRAKLDQENLRGAAELYTGIFRLLISLGLLFSASLTSFSEPIILLLFGPEYLDAVNVFRLLAVALIPIFIYSFHVLMFVAYNRQHYIILSRGIGLIAVCCLYSLLIPRHGVLGAAGAYLGIAIAIGYVESLLLQYRIIHAVKSPLGFYFLNLMLASGLSLAFIFNYSWRLRVALLFLIMVAATLQLKGNYAIFLRYRQGAARACHTKR